MGPARFVVFCALITSCTCFSTSGLGGILASPFNRYIVLPGSVGRERLPPQVLSGTRKCCVSRFLAQAKSDYVSIFIGDGLKDQQLPLSMTKSFQHWILHDGALRGVFNSDADGKEDGWVDPFSYQEAWLADDLPAPVLRPALGALVKGGELRYIMPAVEMSVLCGGKLWWNRGVNTFPLAQRWMDIGSTDLTSLSLFAFAQGGYKTAETSVLEMAAEGEEGAKDKAGDWQELWSAAPDKALLSLIETLAVTVGAGPAGECVESGFHVVVVPLSAEDLRASPAAGTRFKLVLADRRPAEGTLDDAQREGAAMDVLFRAATAGGDSEYLPTAYRELYSRT